MKKKENALLWLVKAALHSVMPEDPNMPVDGWVSLLRLANFHKLIPLVMDAACGLPSLRRASAAKSGNPVVADEPVYRGGENELDYKTLRDEAVSQACRQAIQENEFLNLILEMREAGLEPVVVKGAVCRALYPKPLLRPSVDDDLLIPAEQAEAFHRFLLDHNLAPDEPDYDVKAAWELSYHRPNSPLYIEVHKCLFDPASPVFSGWNAWFAGAIERTVPIQIQDVSLRTLHPTDHLLFLILHAFKHFLHSGFGLRIVSDVALFAGAYGEEIDFSRLLEACRELRCLEFTAAVFRIAEKHLGIPAPAAFSGIETDEGPLLADILDAGIHGQDIDRLHSANITLRTVAADRRGTAPAKSGLRASLFPSAKQLAGRYPFLNRCPWLLPVAWVRRMGTYLRDRRKYKGADHPTASLRIGRERVALLEAYNIIDRIQ